MDVQTRTTTENSTIPTEPPALTDNTTTFLVGFGVLLIFVIVGVLASAFLCITLKKDPYLWDAERERQLQEKKDGTTESNAKERDKINIVMEDKSSDGVSI